MTDHKCTWSVGMTNQHALLFPGVWLLWRTSQFLFLSFLYSQLLHVVNQFLFPPTICFFPASYICKTQPGFESSLESTFSFFGVRHVLAYFKKTWYFSARLSISMDIRHGTCHAALNAIAYIVGVKQFVMSPPLGYWFTGSRKGGTGGGGLVYTPKGWKQHGCGFACKKSSVGSLHKWSWKIVISSHKCDLLAG